jgi:hypothetical protein
MGQHVNTWGKCAGECGVRGIDTEAGLALHCDRTAHPAAQEHAMFVPGRMEPIRWRDGRVIPPGCDVCGARFEDGLCWCAVPDFDEETA